MSRELVTAQDMLETAVRVGPWPVGALREVLYAAGFSEWHVSQATRAATRSGEMVMFQRRFWASPSFIEDGCDSHLFIEGHSREQLIARLSARSRPPDIKPSTTESVMQGEDAGRLAREDFGRNG